MHFISVNNEELIPLIYDVCLKRFKYAKEDTLAFISGKRFIECSNINVRCLANLFETNCQYCKLAFNEVLGRDTAAHTATLSLTIGNSVYCHYHLTKLNKIIIRNSCTTRNLCVFRCKSFFHNLVCYWLMTIQVR